MKITRSITNQGHARTCPMRITIPTRNIRERIRSLHVRIGVCTHKKAPFSVSFYICVRIFIISRFVADLTMLASSRRHNTYTLFFFRRDVSLLMWWHSMRSVLLLAVFFSFPAPSFDAPAISRSPIPTFHLTDQENKQSNKQTSKPHQRKNKKGENFSQKKGKTICFA